MAERGLTPGARTRTLLLGVLLLVSIVVCAGSVVRATSHGVNTTRVTAHHPVYTRGLRGATIVRRYLANRLTEDQLARLVAVQEALADDDDLAARTALEALADELNGDLAKLARTAADTDEIEIGNTRFRFLLRKAPSAVQRS